MVKFRIVSEPVTEFVCPGKLDDAQKLEEFFRCVFEDITVQESFYVTYLDNSLKLIDYKRLFVGGITATVVDPAVLCRYALLTGCKHVVICHNHPSGTLVPSEADKSITKKIAEGLRLFDIQLVDHIILAPFEGYYSFAYNGEI
jgi:DNA repair protein RadC